MISEKKTSPGLKAVKILYELLTPIFCALAVICLILAFFEPAEGSKSGVINWTLLIISVVAILVLKFTDNFLRNKYPEYKIYQSAITRKLDWANFLPLVLMAVLIALPFYILLVTSFKTPLEASGLEFTWWPKDGIDLESYKELFTYTVILGTSMLRITWNSFIYAIIPTVIGVLVSALSAYAFSKLKFPHRNLWYRVLIMTMMMPGCVTMTTSYIMFNWYGWTNTALPLIVPGCFGAAATVMFMREFFMGIPDEMLEAARIDGAGKWRCFFEIILPLGKPAILAQLILGFIGKYNDFLGPLIYLNDPEGYTIQVALDFINASTMDKSLVASASVFALVPMLLLYVIFQKRILSGISMSSGLKG